jgi:hypothetical protein
MKDLNPESIAREWIDAFNAYDVDRLVSLYDENATHTSPKIRALHPETGGKLIGKRQLSEWWRDSNRRIPGLRYQPTAIIANAERVIIEYLRHAPNEPPMPVAEAFDIRDGKIIASRVYHG